MIEKKYIKRTGTDTGYYLIFTEKEGGKFLTVWNNWTPEKFEELKKTGSLEYMDYRTEEDKKVLIPPAMAVLVKVVEGHDFVLEKAYTKQEKEKQEMAEQDDALV